MFPDERLKKVEIKELNGVTLAFIGDSVYELMVRSRILAENQGRVQELHKKTVAFSNASFQALAAKKLQPRLSEAELSVFKRGRNSHPGHTPKNKSQADYHLATGLEALFGWLYITNKTERLAELFEFIEKEANNINYEKEQDKRK
ncbi:MAG: ribonuclease III [Oscillospiraceae bacterium]|nr:ribonuclease III [Oscillospiraceae bacterium]